MKIRQVVYVDYEKVLNRLLALTDITHDDLDTPQAVRLCTFRAHRKQLKDNLDSYLAPGPGEYDQELMNALFEHQETGTLVDVQMTNTPGRVIVLNRQSFFLPLIRIETLIM